MERVCLYARVSTLEHQQFDRQISDLEAVIIAQGYNLDQIDYYAENISGFKKTSDRPQLTKLLNKIESEPHLYKCLYVQEISRIGRDPQSTRLFIDRVSELGVPIYIQSINQKTIDENGQRNYIVNIVLQVLMEFSGQEVLQMKSRMKSGKLQKVTKEGQVSGANQAYGYMNVDKMFVINPDEAVVVENIFQLYKQGNGTQAIAHTLNQMGIKTRLAKTHSNKNISFKNTNSKKLGASVKWSDATIRQILKNTTYKGKRIYKEVTFDCPAIVSEQLFDECTAIRLGKTHRNFLTTYEYLLRDMMYCGCCGKKYMGVYSTRVRDSKIYKCTSTLTRGGACGNLGINISLIESVIYNQLIRSESLLKLLENPNDLLKDIETDIVRLEQLLLNEKEAQEIKQKEIERLVQIYTSNNSFLIEVYEKQQDEKLQELESIKNKINLTERELFSKKLILTNHDKKTATIEMLVKAKSNRTELRAIFKQFIGKLIINTLDKKYTLITMFIKLKGVTLISTVKTIINVGGIKAVRFKENRKYQYMQIVKMENDPVYVDNILKVEKEDILNEYLRKVNQYQQELELYNSAGFTLTDTPALIDVPRENLILIEDTYPLIE
ncbi:recombinase family protein [Flavobacterium artemisiae]|uniref:Recombinase family protein n=1 Tax=Flavobacterium artemisiae TaxID=2126556 RepID=A0ABW4HBY5_9FLAO